MYLPGTNKTKKGAQRRPPATPPAADSTSAGSDPDDTPSSEESEQEEQKAAKYKIPKRKYKRTKAEIEQYRRDLKNLNEHSDEFFCSHGLQELIKLYDKLGGGKKARHKLTERLSRNLERSKKFPKQVPAGQDNRADILHEARFMEGHTGKNTDLWLKARSKIGLTGYEPVSKYDFEGVGVQDRLNSYIVSILHNPGAPQFSIKMLSKQALDAARGGRGRERGKTPN